jgi:hypothetical protein
MTSNFPARFAAAALTALAVAALPFAAGAEPPRPDEGHAVTKLKTNLVHNPGAEEGTGADNGSVVPIPDWTVVGNFTAVKYGIPAFPKIRESERIHGGDHFFAGGPEDHFSKAIQIIEVYDQARLIDLNRIKLVARAHQAGYQLQADNGQVIVEMLDEDDRVLRTLKLPVIRGTHEIFERTKGAAFVPPRTRKLRVTLSAIHGQSNYLDAYFDNIDVRIGRRGAAF